MNYYKCKHCGVILERDSDKQWIKSYCDQTGRNTRIRLIKKPEMYDSELINEILYQMRYDKWYNKIKTYFKLKYWQLYCYLYNRKK